MVEGVVHYNEERDVMENKAITNKEKARAYMFIANKPYISLRYYSRQNMYQSWLSKLKIIDFYSIPQSALLKRFQ